MLNDGELERLIDELELWPITMFAPEQPLIARDLDAPMEENARA
jgi:hypothetical protein